ncbi:MAG: fructose-specific PTS transporter subunit EIIC [Treponema sp.]|jgi:PTS system fructose-specific IIC component|nr:fructose-specific PTS transporter subunit EIIC [Treponema sp.]
MPKNFWVLIDSTNAELKAQIAEQSLRNAAEKAGSALRVEIRDAQGIRLAFKGTPEAGDALLVIGNAEPSAVFAGLPRTNASLEEALRDSPALLEKAAKADTTAPAGNAGPGALIVAITSCPTGIAHTFMAAEGLEKAAAELGYRIRVETQGSVGAGNPLTAEEIAAASLVIIAADREIDRSRFGGKRVFSSGTNAAITDGRSLIKRAFAEAALETGSVNAAAAPTGGGKKRTGPYKHLMTGVSFMLPFVVAGGLCVALAFAVGGINAEGNLAQFLMKIGGSGGFALMVPILAGYIAFSIADRPGIAPGMIGGILCNMLGTGFLGGIAAGFIAGYSVYLLKRFVKMPKNLAGLMPILVLPLLGTLITCLLINYVIGTPFAALNNFLTAWLKGLGGANSMLLGLLLGGMMAVDMGGPVNKAAYAFSVGMLEAGVFRPMAAVMAAGMTPPLAVALAVLIFKTKFTQEDREAGPAAAVLGFAFISEGAIPFAAKDPIRVLSSFIVGSALTGALSMLFNIELHAPHGGVFVLFIPGAVNHIVLYFLAIAAGTVLSAVLLGVLKKKAV